MGLWPPAPSLLNHGTAGTLFSFFIVQLSTWWSWSPSYKALLYPVQSSPSRDLQASPYFQELLSNCLFKSPWATISPFLSGDLSSMMVKTRKSACLLIEGISSPQRISVDVVWFWKWPEHNTSDKHKWDWWKYIINAPNPRRLVDFYYLLFHSRRKISFCCFPWVQRGKVVVLVEEALLLSTPISRIF